MRMWLLRYRKLLVALLLLLPIVVIAVIQIDKERGLVNYKGDTYEVSGEVQEVTVEDKVSFFGYDKLFITTKDQKRFVVLGKELPIVLAGDIVQVELLTDAPDRIRGYKVARNIRILKHRKSGQTVLKIE